jgi:hypothetical protein
MGLFWLTAFLDTFDDSALQGAVPGVRRALCDQRRDIFQVIRFLGTRFANTNSSSKEQRSFRITNSSSKEGEGQADSAEQSKKSGDSSTNTKFEEQAL